MIGSGYDRAGTPEAPVGPRVRVYELAKDLGVQPKDLVNKVRAMAIDVANHMSQIDAADVERIKRAVERERHESLVEERLNDTGSVIRRRSKNAPPAGAPARQVVTPAAAAPAAPVLRAPAPPVADVTPAVAVMAAPFAWAQSFCATATENCRDAPGPSEAMVHFTWPLPPTGGVVQVHPAGTVTAWNPVCAGTAMVMATLAAGRSSSLGW